MADADIDAPAPCTDWTAAQVMLLSAANQHAWASVVGAAAPKDRHDDLNRGMKHSLERIAAIVEHTPQTTT